MRFRASHKYYQSGDISHYSNDKRSPLPFIRSLPEASQDTYKLSSAVANSDTFFIVAVISTVVATLPGIFLTFVRHVFYQFALAC